MLSKWLISWCCHIISSCGGTWSVLLGLPVLPVKTAGDIFVSGRNPYRWKLMNNLLIGITKSLVILCSLINNHFIIWISPGFMILLTSILCLCKLTVIYIYMGYDYTCWLRFLSFYGHIYLWYITYFTSEHIWLKE